MAGKEVQIDKDITDPCYSKYCEVGQGGLQINAEPVYVSCPDGYELNAADLKCHRTGSD